MSVVAIFVLAVLQGVAEFLPISSSGHLVIVEGLFRQMGTEIAQPFTLNIVLHAGTLLSVLVVFWNKIWRLLGADRRVIGLLIVGTIPAAVVGLPLKAYGGHLLNSPLLAGAMLPLTGIMLLWAMRRAPGTVDYTEMTYRQALCIGLAQAVALLPGISRSGSTICAGLAVGLKRDSAAAFSFLLAIPAIGGACVLELRHLLKEGAIGPNDPSPWLLLSAAAVSFVVGVLALRVLFVALEKGRLKGFAWWCILAGVATVVWHLTWPPPPPSEQVNWAVPPGIAYECGVCHAPWSFHAGGRNDSSPLSCITSRALRLQTFRVATSAGRRAAGIHAVSGVTLRVET